MVQQRLREALPGAVAEWIPNPAPSAQHSILLNPGEALRAALFLRDAPDLRFDYCSNVTGVDWLDTDLVEKIKVKQVVDGVEKEIEETRKTFRPGYLEAVYHLYSIEKSTGPLVIRMRTLNRTDQVHLPSLTPVWRSCELQEREIFDLYGIVFDGHPDLRRLLMWDDFADHPMRKDYVPPDDHEYEPTPH